MKGKLIAVDLTPILPGGENGGAKIFVLELIQLLAALEPHAKFVLLTHQKTHEELAKLDRSNLRRLMVIEQASAVPATSVRVRLISIARAILPHLPGRLRRVVGLVGYKLNITIKRRTTRRSLLREMGVDLLFCPFTAPTFFEIGIPTVCIIYDLQYKTHPEFFDPADVAHRDHTFLDACQRATGLVAISEYSRTVGIAHGNIAPDRIQTIYLRMARRLEAAPYVENTVLNRLELKPQLYLLYPANFWRHKNHEMLFTAFGMACKVGLPPEIRLVCTGASGERLDYLKQAAAALHLADRIFFPGFLPDSDIAVLMANCRGVIFPSLYEGFGLPVIEAMASGVPVACSNLTSLPEVAGNAALLFDPRVPDQIAMAIRNLVENDILRCELRTKGTSRAALFLDADRMANEYMTLFKSSIEKNSIDPQLSGFYTDGWVEPNLIINLPPSNGSQSIEIEFFAPDWLWYPKSNIKVTNDTGTFKRKIYIKRGNHSTLIFPVSREGGCFNINISPTLIPFNMGMGDDKREISLMITNFIVINKDGERLQLMSKILRST